MTNLLLCVVAVLLLAAPAAAADHRGIEATAARPDPDAFVVYQVGSKGDIDADMEAFARHVRTTLLAPRGWSLGGKVWFAEVERSSKLRIWLASPQAIADASTGCSAAYSCRVGDDVYINVRRWRGGARTYAGRSLTEYRSYVINHEIGHWLELEHRGCAAVGRRAPVMQQQTKVLDGCRANVWPLASERRAALRRIADIDD